MQLLAYLSRWSPASLSVAGLMCILLIGVCDYITGSELSFAIFYLMPIALVTWMVGKHQGLALSIIGTLLWLGADILTGAIASHPAVPYWNAAVRLGFFLIVTYMLASLQTLQKRQEDLRHFVVHDLRAPLSIVMTGLQTMQELAGEHPDSTQQDLIEMCAVSCQRMLTLINSLLDLARLENGQLPLQLAKIDIQELITSSLQQMSIWAGRNQVTLASHLDPESACVYADIGVTARILSNLLSNAVRFSPPHSTVSVRVTSYSAETVAFSITDQGRGIAQEWQEKVFDKFAQADFGKTRGTVGSGLGLTFCRLAVEAQGGQIWLHSEEHVGTTVSFTLPRCRQ
ncbi:MAG: sensor histidine kinase [Candidatus Tectimicrobiota bacterium]